MKLENILDNLNSLEKNSFLKIIDTLINENPKNINQINEILNEIEGELKNADHIYITKIFNLLEQEYSLLTQNEFSNISSQLDILTDIIIRDGNCLMSRDWLSSLYEKEIEKINKKMIVIKNIISEGGKDIDPNRIRDYRIYNGCVNTAYYNDIENKQEPKITFDEQTILHTLST